MSHLHTIHEPTSEQNDITERSYMCLGGDIKNYFRQKQPKQDF